MQFALEWYTMEYPTNHLHFLCKDMGLQASVYVKKVLVTSEIFHGML